MSNLETLLTAWLTDGEVPEDFQPETRIEEYLVAILEGVDDSVTPKSRADVLLDAIAAKYAGYADGLDEIRDALGFTGHPIFDEAKTPHQIAEAQDAVNESAVTEAANKGVTIESDDTFGILQELFDNWPSGGGIHYSAVDYDAATNTYTLTEKDDPTITHTLTCTYDAQGRINGMEYDGNAIAVTYNNDGTVTVGGTVVDVREYAVTGGVDPFALTDYIETSGTQYIDTGYIVKSNTKFVATYSGNTPGEAGKFPSLYGARIEYQNNSCQFIVRQITYYVGLYSWSDRVGTLDDNSISMSSWFDSKNVLTVDKNGLLLQKASPIYSTNVYGRQNSYSGTPINNLPVYIFTLNDGGTANAACFLTGKLYCFKIYEGEKLVHEFLPYIDGNNVVCLKDTVTGNIKYNAGTGVFTYGTDA